MKRSTSILVAALAALSLHAHAAGDASQAFTVEASLVAKCETTHTTNPTITIPAYTAFGAAKSENTDIAFKCTKGLTPTDVEFDTGGDGGTLKGLVYSLTVGTAAVTADAASGGDVRTYNVVATMAAGQAGDNNPAAPASKAHTLKITF